MNEIVLLRVLVAIEVVAIALILLAIAGRTAERWWRARQFREAYVATRQSVVERLDSGEGVPGSPAAAAFGSLPRRLQIRMIWELAPHLTGKSNEALAELAVGAGLDEWADQNCRSPKWWKRLQGIRLLTLLRIDRRGARTLIQDPHPLVRATALEWAADFVTGPNLRRLVWRLDDDSALCRFTIQDALLGIGRPTVPALCNYLEDRGEDANPSALDIAAGIAEPRFSPIAERLSGATNDVLRAKATTLIAAIGGGNAVEKLRELLGDKSPSVRAAACRGVGTLKHWELAPAVGRCLRDPAWEVRRDAALALQSLGGPGQIVLRRFTEDDDAFAADMARYILEVPSLPGVGPAR